MQHLLQGTAAFLTAIASPAHAQDNLPYTTYTSFDQWDGHGSYLPGQGGNWVVSDTYVDARGYQYLFLHHVPTKLFVPLAKLKSTLLVDLNTDCCRVDTHPRLSRDGRLVCFDASIEGLGRQMYIIDIGYILDHPPTRR